MYRFVLLFAAVIALRPFLALAAALLCSARAAGGEFHPQDGPHVDLRFELRSDAFTVEASMNLLFLDGLLGESLRDALREQPDRIELSELRAMRSVLVDRMADACRVLIDGRAIEPRIEGLAKNDPDEALLPLFPRSGFLGLRKIRFELVYPIEEAPRSIAVAWFFYPDDELSLLEPKPPLAIATEFIAQGIRTDVLFEREEPEFIWHALPTEGGVAARLRSVPPPAGGEERSVSVYGLLLFGAGGIFLFARRRRSALVVCALGVFLAWALPYGRVGLGRSGALPDEEEARTIFRPLHANLYRAFDFVEDAAIYDALALSVDGPLLEELFLTIHRSLVMQEEGGAVSRVRALREVALDVESVGRLAGRPGGESIPGFIIRCRYRVEGRVTHWGHTHDRTNEYLARYTIVARPEGWRIADVQVLEQARVDGLPGVFDDGSFEL